MIAPAGICGILHLLDLSTTLPSGAGVIGFTRHCIRMNRVECRRNRRQLLTLLHQRPPEGAGHSPLSSSLRRGNECWLRADGTTLAIPDGQTISAFSEAGIFINSLVNPIEGGDGF